jgi:hypothetical protein
MATIATQILKFTSAFKAMRKPDCVAVQDGWPDYDPLRAIRPVRSQRKFRVAA